MGWRLGSALRCKLPLVCWSDRVLIQTDLEVEDSLCWAVCVKKIVLELVRGYEAWIWAKRVVGVGLDVLWNCRGAGAEDDYGGAGGGGLYDDSGGGGCGAG